MTEHGAMALCFLHFRDAVLRLLREILTQVLPTNSSQRTHIISSGAGMPSGRTAKARKRPCCFGPSSLKLKAKTSLIESRSSPWSFLSLLWRSRHGMSEDSVLAMGRKLEPTSVSAKGRYAQSRATCFEGTRGGRGGRVTTAVLYSWECEETQNWAPLYGRKLPLTRHLQHWLPRQTRGSAAILL